MSKKVGLMFGRFWPSGDRDGREKVTDALSLLGVHFWVGVNECGSFQVIFPESEIGKLPFGSDETDRFIPASAGAQDGWSFYSIDEGYAIELMDRSVVSGAIRFNPEAELRPKS